jgi:hypothetical protein
MKKSEIYSNIIQVVVRDNQEPRFEVKFRNLRQLFQDYESAVCAEEWEAKCKESGGATDTASTVLFTEVD